MRQTCVRGYLNGWLGGVCVVTVPEGSQERLVLREKRNHRKRLSDTLRVCLGKIRIILASRFI